MLPERYQDVPCAITPASSSNMRRSATQPSHLNSSLPSSATAEPKASPPLIVEWLQPLSAAACSLACLPLHTKPALAAVRPVVCSAFHVQRCHCTEPCIPPRFGRLTHARPSAAVRLSASCIKKPAAKRGGFPSHAGAAAAVRGKRCEIGPPGAQSGL